MFDFNVELPKAYDSLVKLLSVFSFSFTSIISTRCLSETSSNANFYASSLYFKTAGPFAMLWMVYFGWLFKAWREPHKAREYGQLHLEMVLLMIHILLPMASLAAVEGLVCDEYDYGDESRRSLVPRGHSAEAHQCSGCDVDVPLMHRGGRDAEISSRPGRRRRRYLRADSSVDCDSKLYERFIRPYAILMCVVYPIGVPLTYFALLFRSRRLLNPHHTVDVDGVGLPESAHHSLGLKAEGEDDRSESFVDRVEMATWRTLQAAGAAFKKERNESEAELDEARRQLLTYARPRRNLPCLPSPRNIHVAAAASPRPLLRGWPPPRSI